MRRPTLDAVSAVTNVVRPAEQKITVPIASALDIVTARQLGRTLASQLGYSLTEATLIATAISELARNIVSYAKRGDIVMESANNGTGHGVVVVARDEGPGIADVPRGRGGRVLHLGQFGARSVGRAEVDGRLRDHLRARQGHEGYSHTVEALIGPIE